MFRLRRVFPFSRVVSRPSPPLPQGSLFKVRHVKLQRPWIRTLFKRCFIYGVAFHLWSSFVLLQFDEDDETQELLVEGANRGQERRDTDANADTQESSDSDEMFVPLGWPQIREGELYAASDPEWQEFVKLSRDREKLQALRDELASIALTDASRSHLLSRILGGPLTVTRTWLVHQFPSRAPPTYSRSGLNITDDGVSWTSKPMSAEDGDRLLRCARPLHVTLAIKDAFMVILKRQTARLRMAGSGQEQLQETTDSPSQKKEFSRDIKSLDGLDRIPQSRSPPSHVSREGASQENTESSLYSSILRATLQMLPLPKFEPDSDLFAASLAFQSRLRDCKARERHTPRRGVFYFSGPVGLRGPKGFCRVEVQGEYDTVAASWSSVTMQFKDLGLFKQKARGRS
ncbi:hypothetical protein P170DRAFT_449793 [Aspergillus steynii IBT 23096]|uniref:Uncharacterized protein n=1 Tax=Aspergillus steynii IBT 23096 TaxID=1392250 RepID=A0A2I2FVM0_9EURO|nr:uncharacterized protein P170DRAFT_449793 [Aspergillus steynii IBT 23096]PLB44680.1 hypothetical protein P170DRAFT_449793 [Aspergillus steynii IBT 23096]